MYSMARFWCMLLLKSWLMVRTFQWPIKRYLNNTVIIFFFQLFDGNSLVSNWCEILGLVWRCLSPSIEESIQQPTNMGQKNWEPQKTTSCWNVLLFVVQVRICSTFIACIWSGRKILRSENKNVSLSKYYCTCHSICFKPTKTCH